ncbi:MAG: hypothetical protein ACUVVU_03275 [Tepidimonas sp.]|uniref:hypothetical protein n=1 Tax=Tepidimonas sp. TaxID=2002775 RepID=UPI0040552D28
MTPPGRQPPPVVPTLTDVVELSTVPSAPPPAPQAVDAVPQLLPDTLVDEVTDRVLARLLPELEGRIADALRIWFQAQSDVGARAIADTLRDQLAEHVRVALGDALGSTRH